jgi:hypothetical protein
MSTHLFDDSDLDSEDYEWDAFVPEPDDAVTDADALSDDDDLDLDDSEFDWEAALDDESDMDVAAEARVEAAFDRMYDSIRRNSGEADLEPEPEFDADDEQEDPEFVIVPESEVRRPEPETAGEIDAELEDEPELILLPDPDEITESAAVAVSEQSTLDEPQHRSETALEPEHEGLATELDADPFAALAAEYELEAELSEDDVDSELGLEETDVESELEAESEAQLDPEAELEEDADIDFLTETELDAEPESFAPIPPVHVEDEPEWDELDAPWSESEWDSEDELDAVPAPVAATATSFQGIETETAEPDAQVHPEFAAASETAPPRGPTHDRRIATRSPVFTATVVVGCLFLVVVSAAGIARTLHNPAASTPASPATTVPAATASAEARLQTATDDADSATTTAQAGLTSLPGFPTPTNVAAVINPYVASLRIYQTFLAGATVPASAQSAAAAATAELGHDVTSFSSIDGLPPIRLGAYLDEFSTDVTHLETTLSALEEDLRTAPAS